MTPFSALLRLAGLSLREASEFHRVPPATVNSWSSGRRTCPPGVIQELQSLISKQHAAAAAAVAQIEAARKGGDIDAVTLGFPSDDQEAKSIGWPSVGAWGAVAARIIAEAPAPIVLAPRGATPATAAAADIRDAADRT